jgi:hypothetical protein
LFPSLTIRYLAQVRVVIWKCKDVPPMDTLEGMSDLFVKCWPESCTPQETDTHWRAKKGNTALLLATGALWVLELRCMLCVRR